MADSPVQLARGTPGRMRPVPTAEDVYRENVDFVGRFAFRLLGDDSEVDDVVQEVFFKLVRRFEDLEQHEELRPWLAKVTLRAARHKLQRRRWLRTLGFRHMTDQDDAPGKNAPHEHRMMLRDLYGALDGLSTDERIAWTLRHVEGEQLEQIAAQCGVSLATVKRRIHRAHDRLKRELGFV